MRAGFHRWVRHENFDYAGHGLCLSARAKPVRADKAAFVGASKSAQMNLQITQDEHGDMSSWSSADRAFRLHIEPLRSAIRRNRSGTFSIGCMTMSDQITISNLQSGVVTSPADAMLKQAITATLDAAPNARAGLFERLVCDIQLFMAAHSQERPWTCTFFTGTDGSRIFRGGVGHSLVIDKAGRLWRARSYEDFATTYLHALDSCEIATLAPLYAQMREYRPRNTTDT